MGRKPGLKSMVWSRRKKEAFYQNKDTRIQKNEEKLGNLQDNCKPYNIQIIGLPEGEEEDQEIENLL